MREYDLSSVQWRKSSYSNGEGGDCVEVGHGFLGAARWRKSTYSNGEGGSCVEVSDDFPGIVPVRDSKNPAGPALVVEGGAWQGFVNGVRSGAL
ncbi:DUF397 domain-containing protein [Streptomyces sp. NPDC059095]|uniref:DUF397 domain-containing protein n=1 Tax=Streptomyces sp. NPDC059095 TaxID=3346726 RepID=UPI003698BA00